MSSVANRSILLVAIAIAFTGLCVGQVATGIPPFSTSSGGSFDSIDLGNLNINFGVPIFNKAGRGLTFDYQMTYNSSIWGIVTCGATTCWTPVSQVNGFQLWGWGSESTASTGRLIMKDGAQGCQRTYLGSTTYWPITSYRIYGYQDPGGTVHSITSFLIIPNTGPITTCDPGTAPPTIASGSGTAADGSGYVISVTSYGSSSTVTGPNGMVVQNAPGLISTLSDLVDNNGNKISTNHSSTYSVGVYTSSDTFTDTLNTTALTVSSKYPPDPATPATYSYTAPSGGLGTKYTFTYTNKSVMTNFGCTTTDYNASGTLPQVPLLTSITLPDGSTYTFTYEATPAHATFVTGRIASVKLPTGGTISYDYSGGGILCADATPLYLKRTMPDSAVWVYNRSGSTATHGVTKITDPVTPTGNDTVVDFAKDGSGSNNFYEVARKVYSGSSGGTVLGSKYTCYNGSGIATPTGCITTAVSSPITRTTVFNYLPDTTGLVSKLDTYFKQVGSIYTALPYQVDEYDFGSGGGTGGSLLRRTLTTYNNTLTNGIIDRPSVIEIRDGSGATASLTNYTYDQWGLTATTGTPQHNSVTGSRGNLTQTDQKTNGTVTLYRKFVYYDTGMLNSSTEPSTSSGTPGAATTYTYSSSAASCGNSFATNVSEPMSLTRSMAWNCNGGVQTSAVDENGKTTSTSYTTNTSFWWPESSTDAAGNVTTFSYNGQNQVTSSMLFNSGNSVAEKVTTRDPLGRIIYSQAKQGPLATHYDTVGTCYDKNGRIRFVSAPYSQTMATSTWTCPGVSGTTTTYDALDRVATSTDGGGGVLTYTYAKNDKLQVLGPAPAGENTKQKQMEYDGLGHLTSVCEVTGGPGSVSCGQSTAQTGYWTKYTYNPLNNLTLVTQNVLGATSQSRTYAYDMLGRMTSETNPESGTIQYFYDSAPAVPGVSCVYGPGYGLPGNTGIYAGDVVKRYDSNGNTTCYAYDSLHRILGKTHTGAGHNQFYIYDAATVNGVTMTNTAGRLAEAFTTVFSCPACATKVTDEGFSYSARGELSDTYEKTPSSPATYYHANSVYFPNGLIETVSLKIGTTSVFPLQTYQVEAKGRWSAVGASSGQNPVTAATYNTFDQATTVTFGSGDNDAFTYDSATGRMTQYQFKMGTGPTTDTGVLTWSANGTLRQQQITDQIVTTNSQTCTYGYDDLIRVTSSNCGATIWNQNFSYDVFGNINKTVPGGSTGISFTPGYSASTNRFSSGLPGLSYDSNGNLLNDSFNAYTWDTEAKPLSIGSNTYVYDALGRVAEINGTSEIVYGPSGKLAIMNGSTLAKAFIPLPAGATAVYNSGGLAYYRHADWLGSSRLSTTTTRTKYYDVAYAPFGESYGTSGTTDLNFTGDNQDMIAGMYDTPNRELHPIQGRWVTPDPAGMMAASPGDPQSWNRYSYGLNNPLLNTDPEGLATAPPPFEPPLPILPPIGDPSGPGDPPYPGPPVRGPGKGPVKGGGGGKPGNQGQPTISNPSQSGPQQETIQSVLEKIQQQLECDPDCKAFLQSKGTDPVEVIKTMLDNNAFGTADIMGSNGNGVLTAATSGGAPGQLITVNRNGAFFNSITPDGRPLVVGSQRFAGNTGRAQASILLHELGHTTQVLVGDAGNDRAVHANDQDIWDHCKKTIQSF